MNLFKTSLARKTIAGGLFACAVATSLTASAGGTYDGAWAITGVPDSYYIVNQNGNQVLATELNADRSWNVYLGTLSGSSVTFTSLISSVSLNATATFTSATTATLRINSCRPITGNCVFPSGAQTTINKIF